MTLGGLVSGVTANRHDRSPGAGPQAGGDLREVLILKRHTVTV